MGNGCWLVGGGCGDGCWLVGDGWWLVGGGRSLKPWSHLGTILAPSWALWERSWGLGKAWDTPETAPWRPQDRYFMGASFLTCFIHFSASHEVLAFCPSWRCHGRVPGLSAPPRRPRNDPDRGPRRPQNRQNTLRPPRSPQEPRRGSCDPQSSHR